MVETIAGVLFLSTVMFAAGGVVGYVRGVKREAQHQRWLHSVGGRSLAIVDALDAAQALINHAPHTSEEQLRRSHVKIEWTGNAAGVERLRTALARLKTENLDD